MLTCPIGSMLGTWNRLEFHLQALAKQFQDHGLACKLVLAECSYGECQIPITTKRITLNDIVLVVQDCSFVEENILGSRTDLHAQISSMRS
ncbi:hypothetical protein TNCV_4365821 [Trichonephila clavipes]|nr:hypothetical protein TNCV_4365821 [Trichonephila clavipes]